MAGTVGYAVGDVFGDELVPWGNMADPWHKLTFASRNEANIRAEWIAAHVKPGSCTLPVVRKVRYVGALKWQILPE